MRSISLLHVVALPAVPVSAFLLSLPSSPATNPPAKEVDDGWARRSMPSPVASSRGGARILRRPKLRALKADVAVNSTAAAAAATKEAIEVIDHLPAADVFPNPEEEVEFHSFELTSHKPLGCTIEESFESSANNCVFVSKVVPGGCAEQAGIEVGDVIVAVTGTFEGLVPVLDAGIDKM